MSSVSMRSMRAPGWALSLAAWAAINIFVFVGAMAHVDALWQPQDWALWTSLPGLLERGQLYESNFVWSPVAAYLLLPFVAGGIALWMGLHVASLVLLRDRWMITLTLASLPFWADTLQGNTVTFVAVAGCVALRGSRPGALAYLALCVLMPRPIQAPLALWLLWRDRSLWGPTAAMVIGTVGFALLTGYFDDWVARLLSFATDAATSAGNLGPTALVGNAWYVAGIPVAVWLTLRGRVGLAGLSLSPYVWPQYLLVLLWEWRRGAAAPAEEGAIRHGQQRHHAAEPEDEQAANSQGPGMRGIGGDQAERDDHDRAERHRPPDAG
jgi:hypothetical protein